MSLDIVSPADWGMEPIDFDEVATRDLDVVVEANVHHSASEPPSLHLLCDEAVRGFDAYHRNRNGWAALGYNRVICSHGTVYRGRPLYVVPAAAQDHNTPIVAYCLIANDGKATKAQWQALIAMIRHDATRLGHPLRITTHKEVWPYTACPGAAIQTQVNAYRNGVGATIKPGAPKPKFPAFPLPDHHFFGRPSTSKRSHSGYRNLRDRAGLTVWQTKMARRGWDVNTDGRFTKRTLRVVRQFQDEKEIPVTSHVGERTWRAAWREPIT